MAPPSLKTFREIRAAFLARTVTITAAMHGLLGLGLPGAIAMGAGFLTIVLSNPSDTVLLLCLLGFLLWGYSTITVGANADYWERRYREHRNCGDRNRD